VNETPLCKAHGCAKHALRDQHYCLEHYLSFVSHPSDRALRDRKRESAGSQARKAVKAGTLERQPCEVCGSTERVEGHHDDYDQPLAVRWLCKQHHEEAHHPPEQRKGRPRTYSADRASTATERSRAYRARRRSD